MSRTDKTKPWRIRVMEHQPWAEHDHADGVCDLPDDWAANSYAAGHHCTWSDWNLFYKGCCHGCECRMCTGYYERREERRASRHQSQRDCRAAQKRAMGGAEDD